MKILGISAYYHDSAAALVDGGRIVAAAEEERFSRQKHDSRFPENAIRYCLAAAGLEGKGPDVVVFYDKPLLKFHRILETHLSSAPRGLRSFLHSIPLWARDKLWFESNLKSGLKALEIPVPEQIFYCEHHESHAASAFYPSPFEEAAVLTLDGVGEWASTTLSVGEGSRLEILQELHFPHSLGLLYSAFTAYAGFRVNSGEYKLMGLAPYGEPRFVDLIWKELIDLREDGSFRLNMRYFGWLNSLAMTNRHFHRLFGAPPRQPESPIRQRDCDIARSIQEVTEEVVVRLARHARKVTGKRYLCLAGGVALNCVANGRLLREGIFDDLWIQPAAGDSGGALGAALSYWYRSSGAKREFLGQGSALKSSSQNVEREVSESHPPGGARDESEKERARKGGNQNDEIQSDEIQSDEIQKDGILKDRLRSQKDGMQGSLLGPCFSDESIRSFLERESISYETLDPSLRAEQIAELLAKGAVVGVFHGRMEFGPRALGNRSILADPRVPGMQERLNRLVKFRETFRPFAPAVLEEFASDYFELDRPSPYMLLVAQLKSELLVDERAGAQELSPEERVKKVRSQLPAITHVDNSARIQTVNPHENPEFYALLRAFYAKTDCPVLVNTSFNLRGEPIVCTPDDALRCFLNSGLDYLALGPCLIDRQQLPDLPEPSGAVALD